MLTTQEFVYPRYKIGHSRSVARQVVFIFLLIAWTSDGRAAVSGIGIAQGRQLVAAAMNDFSSRVGPYEVKSFDDPPRTVRQIKTTSPIFIYIGDSRLGPVPGIYSNCQANSEARAISCDLRLLDDLIDDGALLFREEERPAVRQRLLQIILAHELGHLALHHNVAGYHGSPNGFSVWRYAHYKIENQADDYAVGLLDALAKDREADYGEIADLTMGAVRKSLCPKTFPAACPCPGYTNASLCSRFALGPGVVITGKDRIAVQLTGTHPEYVVRFAHQLFLSHDPKVRSFYRRDAEQLLSQVMVRDENGKLQSAALLFK